MSATAANPSQADTHAVTVTERAAEEIRKIVEEQELDAAKVHLRVGVKGGGCSGFNYILDLTESVRDSDEIMEQHGVRVVCDPKSLLYLHGTVVDFKDEIMSRGFVFQHPNASATCGCGSSFSA